MGYWQYRRVTRSRSVSHGGRFLFAFRSAYSIRFAEFPRKEILENIAAVSITLRILRITARKTKEERERNKERLTLTRTRKKRISVCVCVSVGGGGWEGWKIWLPIHSIAPRISNQFPRSIANHKEPEIPGCRQERNTSRDSFQTDHPHKPFFPPLSSPFAASYRLPLAILLFLPVFQIASCSCYPFLLEKLLYYNILSRESNIDFWSWQNKYL